MRVTYVHNGVCMYIDNEIIWRVLRSRCSVIERVLAKNNLILVERRQLQDGANLCSNRKI